MPAPSMKVVLAHLHHQARPTGRPRKGAGSGTSDPAIAQRATVILRGLGVTSARDRVSRSFVCQIRQGKAKKATGIKARAVWTAMAEMQLIPGVPREVLAKDEPPTPRQRASTVYELRKRIRTLEARLKGGEPEEVKEVPMLTAPMLRYFGFERNPVFDEVKSPKDVWWGAQHKEAKGVLLEAAVDGRFVRLAGRRGAGKSLVGYAVLDELKKLDNLIVVDPGAIVTGVINETHLITAVIQSIKRRTEGRDEIFREQQSPMRRALAMRYLLVQQRKANRRVVIWIDEAHELKADTFLALKRFMDEVEGIGRRLLSAILIGQNPDSAYNPRARDLSEVTLRLQTYRIQDMHDEMAEYLRFKIERAGGKVSEVVTPSALKAIASRCPFPLDANVLFAQLLIGVYGVKEKPISREHLERVPDDPEPQEAAVSR